MKNGGAGLDHETRRFATEQVQILIEHLESDRVDFAFVARHAATIVQLAESQVGEVRSEENEFLD